MILDIIKTILVALWIMLPAYLANPSAVIFGGGPPVDGGRYWKDGKRILGEGKTWNGLLGGTFAGMFIGWIQNFIVNVSGTTYLPPFDSYGSFMLLFCFLFLSEHFLVIRQKAL